MMALYIRISFTENFNFSPPSCHLLASLLGGFLSPLPLPYDSVGEISQFEDNWSERSASATDTISISIKKFGAAEDKLSLIGLG